MVAAVYDQKQRKVMLYVDGETWTAGTDLQGQGRPELLIGSNGGWAAWLFYHSQSLIDRHECLASCLELAFCLTWS